MQNTFKFCNKYGAYDELFEVICRQMKIEVYDERFVYFIDMDYIPDNNRGVPFDNLSVDYRKIVEGGLKELKYPETECTTRYCFSRNRLIDNLVLLCNRIKEELNEKKPIEYEKKMQWFMNMQDKSAQSFEEAVQRVLFINQVLWQTNHPMMGFGLLDYILNNAYQKDKNAGVVFYQDVLDIITDFYKILHRDYIYKSNALIGDTGQIVIVGQTQVNGEYWFNDLSYAFIEALEKIQLPDPKVLLRVSAKMPKSLMEKAVRCLKTGVGSPVLANDDVIIPLLIADGMEKEDAYNYMTSACWEPLAAWKCPISNNLSVLNYMKALDNLFKREPLGQIDSFEQLKNTYLLYLKRNLVAVKHSLAARRFAYDPLISTFVGDCYERKLDLSEGGAKYFDYGMTTVALGNTVNALLNIKKWVFSEGKLTLHDVRKMVLTNFSEKEEYVELLKAGKNKYGSDNEEVIALVNEILYFTTEQTKDFRNYNGGKVKFGLSSPGYIDAARGFGASFDGRRKEESFQVHISSDAVNSYTELIQFASKVDYGENRYNGNVVDFMVSPAFIENNFEKFVDMLMRSIEVGFFEMQINVLDSDKLIEAKKCPEKYPNLIVRVWGFSSYFHELSEEYQNLLIERALKSEGKV